MRATLLSRTRPILTRAARANALSFDGSGWDGSLTASFLEHTELPAFEQLSGSHRLQRALRNALKELRISRLAGATHVGLLILHTSVPGYEWTYCLKFRTVIVGTSAHSKLECNFLC